EKISMALLIIVGLIVGIRGVYWITNYSTAVHESPFYEALDRVAPLYVWGVPFLLGGIFLILASTHIINQSTRKAFDVYIIFGGRIFHTVNNRNWFSVEKQNSKEELERYFIPRHEFEKEKNEFYKDMDKKSNRNRDRIEDVDNKHTENFYQLQRNLDQYTNSM